MTISGIQAPQQDQTAGLIRRDRALLIIAAIAFLFLVIVQQYPTPEQQTRMGRALHNSAHTPWFFLLSLLLWFALGYVKKINKKQRVKVFVLIALGLALATEAVQLLTPRQASWSDVLANLGGATAAMLLLWARSYWLREKTAWALALAVLSLLIILTGFWGVADILLLRAQQQAQAPVLVDFSNSTERIMRTVRGSWQRVSGVPAWAGFQSRQVAHISITGQSRYPGLTLREPLADWTGYQYLLFDGYLPGEAPLDLDIRLETFTDRGLAYIHSIQLAPGENSVEIPIAVLQGQTNGPENVKTLFIYHEFEGEYAEFYISSLRLR